MLWISWTSILPLLTLICLLIAWLIERKSAFVHVTVATCCILIYVAAYIDQNDISVDNIYMKAASHIDFDQLDRLCEENATMVLFSVAALWYDWTRRLLFRACTRPCLDTPGRLPLTMFSLQAASKGLTDAVEASS